jgi:DNA polymerase elongation subunit (family B)
MIPIEVAPSRDAKTIIKEMEKTMNTHISNELKQFNIGTNYLNIRFEKLCDKIYFYGKKKRYYGHIVLNEEFKQCDEIIARGLEIRRTDWCKLATEYEHKILGMLLNDIKGAIAYHKEYVSNISKLELPKFVIFKSLTKPIGQYKSPPPHVRAAVEGDYIGTKIGYVVTGYHKHKITEVKRYDPDKKQNINPSISYYTERQLIPIYERLLKPLTGKQGTLNGERFGQVTKTKRKRRNEVLGKQQRRFE